MSITVGEMNNNNNNNTHRNIGFSDFVHRPDFSNYQ
jgi:hypothetical protein